jgi:hypothetical protein
MRGFGSTVGNAADSVFDWLNRRARGGVQDTTEAGGADEAGDSDDPSEGDGDNWGSATSERDEPDS